MKLTRSKLRKLILQEIKFNSKRGATGSVALEVWGDAMTNWLASELQGMEERIMNKLSWCPKTQSFIDRAGKSSLPPFNRSSLDESVLNRRALRKLILQEISDYRAFSQTDRPEQEGWVERWVDSDPDAPAGYHGYDIEPYGGAYVDMEEPGMSVYDVEAELADPEGGLIVDEDEDYYGGPHREPRVTGRGQGEWSEEKKAWWRERWPKTWRRSK